MDTRETSGYAAGDFGLHWEWLVALGILWIVLGALAIVAAGWTTLITVIVLGWLLVFTGIVRIVHAFGVRIREGFFLDLLLGVLRIVVGVLMVAMPGLTAVSLTLLLAAFFCVGGLYRIGFGFATRLGSRAWIVLNGLISLALGILIFLQWPSSSIWVIGMFVGIDLIFEGWTMIVAGLAIHHLARTGREDLGRTGSVGV